MTTKMSTVAIDASNLHKGGGVQVAASFINELAELSKDSNFCASFPWVRDVHISAATEVVDNLSPTAKATFACSERNRRPLSTDIFRPLTPAKPDLRFVIFGPTYALDRAKKQILGFADVTSVYPPLPNQHTRGLKSKFRPALSRLFTSRADEIIVETNAMKDRLRQALGTKCPPVQVVSNTSSRTFSKARRPQEVITSSHPKGTFTFIYVARAYPHKNHEFIGELLGRLNDHGTPTECLVTLDESEWNALSKKTRSHCRNLGILKVEELPDAYASADALLFPSLLEAFSATPLEAAAMRIPIFASDRDFVRSTMGNAAIYFDPENAESASAIIRTAISDKKTLHAKVELAFETLSALPNAKDRAVRYVQIIDSQLKLAR